MYTDASFVASGVSAGASATAPSRSAAVCGFGTGFGAREDVWTRELTEDGRIYYFNRATGGSQWHLPNHLYEQGAGSMQHKGSHSVTVFPTHAKAMLRVDCVTEVPAGKASADTASPSTHTAGPSLFGRQAVEALEMDPRNVDKILSVLPQDLNDLLLNEQFVQACESSFNTIAEGADQLSFDESNAALADSIIALKMPKLLPETSRLRQLTNLFDTSGIGAVLMQDFTDFARFVVAVSYLELDLDE